MLGDILSNLGSIAYELPKNLLISTENTFMAIQNRLTVAQM
jgi:hypothetical protein